MHLIELQVKQKGLMETWIPWPWQAKGSLQILCLCRALDSPSGLGKMWFMQALRQQEAAASLNHLLGWQPQPVEGWEVAEGLKQEEGLQHLVAGLQDDSLPQTSRRGLAAPRALKSGTLSTHWHRCPALLSLRPDLPRPKVPGSSCFGGSYPAKDYTDSNDFPT